MVTIPLWKGVPAESEGWDQPEEELTLPNGLVMVRNVSRPSLTVYPAARPNGTAVIVAPGGAFHFLAVEHEGCKVAEWFAARGVTAFLLKYRVIQTRDIEADLRAFFEDRAHNRAVTEVITPLYHADGQQAVRLVRENSSDWDVKPDRIGLMGFSAGGAVAARTALLFTPDSRPDFAAPIYGAVFEDVVAPPDAPPLFLASAADDTHTPGGSLRLYSAWLAANRPVELHIYAKGGHGFGMNKQDLPSDCWIERMADWIESIGKM